jgi:protoporphyrinogen oxidase
MGLAVAYQLVCNGHKPVLFEADDRVGGMTATFNFSGLEIERYYHFHCTSDIAFINMLDELGISNKLHWAKTKMGYWYRGELQQWGNPVALLKFRGLSVYAKVRYGLHTFLTVKRRNWRPLDKVYATEWLKRWVGEEAYEVLWRRLFEYKFHHYAKDLSAAWIWSRIRRIGNSRYSLFHEKLGYLDGGSSTLLKALTSSIEKKGGEIRLRSPIERVVIKDNRVIGVYLAGKLEPFNKVISTIPLPYVSKVMPDLPPYVIDKIKAIKNIAVVCVIVKLKKSVSGNFWLNINDPDIEIPGLVEYTNLRPLSEAVVYAPFYLPAEHPLFAQPDSVFIGKVRRLLPKINPRIQQDDFIDICANRYLHAQPICEPGHLERLPPIRVPVTGLWIADTSFYYPEDRGISESMGFGRNLAKLAVGLEN